MKKKKYICPETEVLSVGSSTLMAGSPNNKPYISAKPYEGSFREEDWDDDVKGDWEQVGYPNDLPQSKSLWDE